MKKCPHTAFPEVLLLRWRGGPLVHVREESFAFACDWLCIREAGTTVAQTGVPKRTSKKEEKRIFQLLEDLIYARGVTP
jgi:hypothetical protein